ncbi:hypothetical protein ES703_93647 [subsurface metagenome]
MRFIVDTNILISGLIKDSVTRKILLSDKFEFYHPEILLEELNKHIPEIAKKARKDEKDINQLIKIFRENLLSVSIDEYEQNLDKANDIIGSIDEKDVAFIALALATKNNGIWTNDKHFRKQDKVKVVSTWDMMNLLQIASEKDD